MNIKLSCYYLWSIEDDMITYISVLMLFLMEYGIGNIWIKLSVKFM